MEGVDNDMPKQQYPQFSSRWKYVYPVLAGMAVSCLPLSFSSAQAATFDPDVASAQCREFISSVRNPLELADNTEALAAIKICIDLGVDPPLKVRNDYGRAPASGITTNQIAGRTCPPFSTCLYGARVSESGADPIRYNEGGSGGRTNAPIEGAYTAPQFSGHLPPEIPEHLTNGSTIYFYGNAISITPPMNTLIYPASGMNYYADGGIEVIQEGHVMTPAAPNGDIMAQRPVTVNQETLFNFDDGGALLLPAGYTGNIGGVEVKAGDIVLLLHSGDVRIPAGTKLYPLPMGNLGGGVHANEPEWQPYSGPQIKYPPNALVFNQPTQPGEGKWWTLPPAP